MKSFFFPSLFRAGCGWVAEISQTWVWITLELINKVWIRVASLTS